MLNKWNTSNNTIPPEYPKEVVEEVISKTFTAKETAPSFTWSSYPYYPQPHYRTPRNLDVSTTIPNPFQEHWFIGKTPVYSGYRVFAFKASFEKLITIINFTNHIVNNSFWNGGDFYGEIQLYLKEYFETYEEAMKFGQKIAREHKLSELIWNQFPDPWEDK